MDDNTYTFEDRIDHAVYALHKMRNLHGLEWGGSEPYADNDKEDGPGAFIAMFDCGHDDFAELYTAREPQGDEREQLEQLSELEDMLDSYGGAIPQEFVEAFDEYTAGEDRVHRHGNVHLSELDETYWDKNQIEADISAHDIYRQLFHTFEDGDGAVVHSEDGFAPMTYQVQQLPIDETPDGLGTKHRAAEGLAGNPLYVGDGEPVDVRAIVLSETTGHIRVYRPQEADDGSVDAVHTEHKYGVEIEAPDDWAEIALPEWYGTDIAAQEEVTVPLEDGDRDETPTDSDSETTQAQERHEEAAIAEETALNQ